MKILQLFGGLIRTGGEEMFVLGCMKAFDREDMQFDCLVIEDCGNEDFRSFVESRGGSVYELKIPLHATRFMNHIYKPVCEFFRTHSYDVVHIHSSSISALAVLSAAAKRAGTKRVIVHSHSTGKSDSLEHKVFRALAAMSMRGHVDVYCACSKAAAQWKFAPKYAARAVIVNNGVDTDRFHYRPEAREQIRERFGITQDAFVIGHVGRLCAVKNQGFLIRVFAKIAAEDENARLLLCGDGEDQDSLTKAVEAANIADRVVFAGNVTDPETYLCAMDVFAFPSLYEGLGIVAIEAQAAGLPVIASDGVPREIKLSDRVRFLPIDQTQENIRAWADAIEVLRDTPRADGTAIVTAAGYDIRSTVRQLEEIYAGGARR